MQIAIYLIVHNETGRCYVGQSRNPLHRWASHKEIARNGHGRRKYIHKALACYGESAFVFSIVEWCDTQDNADAAERKWIAAKRANEKGFGFNLDAGGGASHRALSTEMRYKAGKAMRGKRHSAETRALMSQSQIARAQRDGPTSPETRLKISAANLGKPKHSPESREKLRAAHLGLKASPEARAKMSLSRIGSKHSEETKAKMRATWDRQKAKGWTPDPERMAKLQAGRRAAVVSQETRDKMRDSHLGQKRTPEQCEVIRQARLNLSPEAKRARAERFRATMLAKRLMKQAVPLPDAETVDITEDVQ